jgi:glycosyltransferase involved in cell wall biosynthesis
VDAVITASNHSRREIERYLGVSPARLSIIPDGVARRFHPLPLEKAKNHVASRFGLRTAYLLYVGALTRRKNLERALEAFSLITKQMPAVRFVLAGSRTWQGTPVEAIAVRLGIEDRVVQTGPLADADLPPLYRGAVLFVFPSLYEGFGLPPLEAMACGTPVVCSNAASLPEVVGDAALMVDPTDVGGMAEAMRRVLADAELADDLRQRGLARAAQFTWERTARETVAVYERVVAEGR